MVQATDVGRNPFDATMDQLVARVLGELHVPGMALGVVDGTETWSKGYGVANVDTETKVTPETLFSVGSIAKPFTAAAASLLVDDSGSDSSQQPTKVTWDTPIHNLLPPGDFVLQDPYAAQHITLADCLSHRTGLATHLADAGGPDLRENVRNIRHLAFTADLEVKAFQYSNHMYWVVSYALETITGHSLGEFMRKRLWRPLGMHSTFLSVKDAMDQPDGGEYAAQHMWDADTDTLRTIHPTWDDAGLSGAGALVTNVTDMIKWMRCLLQTPNAAGPISAKTFNTLLSAHANVKPTADPISGPRFAGPVCYGLGWYVAVYRGERVVYHPGGIIGTVASVVMLPDRGFGVVGMCNATCEGGLDAAVWRVVDEKLGVPEGERTDYIMETIQGLQGMKYFATNSKVILFPPESIHSPPRPPPLPLGELLGSYTHPAYGTIVLTDVDEEGRALCGRSLPGYPRTSLAPLRVEHVDGDVFMVRADLIKLIPIRGKALFEHVDGGKVRLGVDFASDLTIWFVRNGEAAVEG